MNDDRRTEPGTGPDELPNEEGLRDDVGGTGAGVPPPSGQFTSAGGGYGVGSGDGTAAGSGEGADPDSPGPDETDWLRSEETGSPHR